MEDKALEEYRLLLTEDKLVKKFRVLRIIATIYDVIAILLLVGAVLSFLGGVGFGVLNGNIVTGLVMGVSGFISGIIAATAAKTVAEVIRLFLTIEENTRKTSILSKYIVNIANKMIAIEQSSKSMQDQVSTLAMKMDDVMGAMKKE